MKLARLIAVVLVLASLPVQAAMVQKEGAAPYYDNLAEAQSVAAEKGLPLLVKFQTTW